MTHPIIFTDCETGGLNPEVHSLLTVGVCVVVGREIVEEASWKIKAKTYTVDPEALRVNGLDLQDLARNGTPLEDASQELRKLTERYVTTLPPREEGGRTKLLKPRFGGHNAGFDLDFIEAAFMGKRWFHHEIVDTKGAASFLRDRGDLEDGSMSLGALYQRVTGRSLEGAHDASIDVRATAELYLALLDLPPRPAQPDPIGVLATELVEAEREEARLEEEFNRAPPQGRLNAEVHWMAAADRVKQVRRDLGERALAVKP